MSRSRSRSRDRFRRSRESLDRDEDLDMHRHRRRDDYSERRDRGGNHDGRDDRYGRGSDERHSSSEGPSRRIFIGNLSFDCDWRDLKDFLRRAGKVVHADILTGRDGRSRGCGVAEFETSEDAARAIRDFNETSYMGRMIVVREDRQQVGTVIEPMPAENHGKQLPWSAVKADLEDLFGKVVRADVAVSREGKPRGYGTVLFESAEEAEKAIKQFNGYEMKGRPLEVRLDLGPPKFRMDEDRPRRRGSRSRSRTRRRSRSRSRTRRSRRDRTRSRSRSYGRRRRSSRRDSRERSRDRRSTSPRSRSGTFPFPPGAPPMMPPMMMPTPMMGMKPPSGDKANPNQQFWGYPGYPYGFYGYGFNQDGTQMTMPTPDMPGILPTNNFIAPAKPDPEQ